MIGDQPEVSGMSGKEEAREISGKTETVSPWRLCIVPMMDWMQGTTNQ
jgi:hypothetical protein